MKLSQKQKAILALIVLGNPDGPIDLDELIDRLTYMPSKDSMHFSIRAMVEKGLIEKGPLENRRGRARRTLVPTPLGRHWAALVCPKPVQAIVLSEEDQKELDDVASLPVPDIDELLKT